MKRFLITFSVVFTVLMLSAMMQGQTIRTVTVSWATPLDATAVLRPNAASGLTLTVK